MRFFGIDSANQKRLAILIPLVALVLSLFVVYPTWQRYREETNNVKVLETKLTTLNKAVEELKKTPPDPVVSAVDDMPSEPPQFLERLRGMAAESDCRLVGFEVLPPVEADPKSPIRARKARVTLEARYQDIRVFVDKLREAPRLYAVTDVEIATPQVMPAAQATSTGPLQAIIEVERYVTPEAMKTALSP